MGINYPYPIHPPPPPPTPHTPATLEFQFVYVWNMKHTVDGLRITLSSYLFHSLFVSFNYVDQTIIFNNIIAITCCVTGKTEK